MTGRHQGMTLVEVLVAIAIWSLFTTMVAVALVMAYHNFHGLDDRMQSYRKASVVFDRLMRRLALCRKLDLPVQNTAPACSAMNVYPPVPVWSSTPWPVPSWAPQETQPGYRVGQIPSFNPTTTAPLAFEYNSSEPLATGTGSNVLLLGAAYGLDGSGNLWEGQYPAGGGVSGANWREVAQNIQSFTVVEEDPTLNGGWHFLAAVLQVQTLGAQPMVLCNHAPLQSLVGP